MDFAVDVAIAGAGLAGLSAAITIRKAFGDRARITVYEKSKDIGGIWRDNVYPGSASDSPVHQFSLSTCQNPNWTTSNMSQPELLAYLNDITDQQDIRPFIHLNKRLKAARWNPSTDMYDLEVENTLTAELSSCTCHILLAATGSLPKPFMPAAPGLEFFKGSAFHSSQWDSGVDLRNKRIAVIGNGSSAAQIVPNITMIEGTQVTQFFKKPNWHVGVTARPISPETRERFRKYPILQRMFRASLYWTSEFVYACVFGLDFLRPFVTKASRNYMKKSAPQKYHNILVPDYPIGCRRIVFDVDYLQSLHRENIQLVNQSVKRFTETGIITANGDYCDFDVIIAATGFDTTCAQLDIQGKSTTLQEFYNGRGGPEAYLGVMVPGFPNFFILGGPNSATGYMSYWFTIECQIQYIIPFIKRLGNVAFSSFEVTQEAHDKYNRTLRKRFRNSVWNTLSSRHQQNAESGKQTFLFPGCVTLYWWWTRTPKWHDFIINGEKIRPRKMKTSRVIIFTSLFLLVTLVIVLVSVEKRESVGF